MIERLGDTHAWTLTEDASEASHAPTGAQLVTEDENHAVLTVPLAGSTAFGTTADLTIRFTLTDTDGAVPQVTQADAEAAMAELTRIAAGGTLAEVKDRTATWTTRIDAARPPTTTTSPPHSCRPA